MKRFVTPEAAVFLALLVGLLWAFRSAALADAGCLWHVVVGERILDARQFMTTDPFTYPFAGKFWIPQQWGAEVLMAVAYRADGFDGLLLAFAAGVAALFTAVFRRLLAAGMGVLLAAPVTVAAAGCSAFHFYARPHMFTVAFLAVTAGVLVDFDRGRVGLRRLALLVPLFVVWTNLHGGVLGGIASFGLVALVWAACYAVGWDSPVKSRRHLLGLGLVLAACCAAPLVNPFGFDMLRTWAKIVGSPAMATYVTEHMPLNPRDPAHRAVLAFAGVFAVVALGAVRSRPRATWVLPAVWFVLSLQSVRQGPLFVIVAAVVLADIWPHTVWHRWLVSRGETLAGEPHPRPVRRSLLLPAVGVAVVVGLHAAKVQIPVVGAGWAELDPRAVPVDLLPPVRGYAQSVPAGTRIYNDANFGGFLIFFAPELRIFMDDRFELCGDDWLEGYAAVTGRHPERFEMWYDTYGFDRALVAADEPLATYLPASGKWVEVARGRTAILFARK